MTRFFNRDTKATRFEFWITCFVTIIVICGLGPSIDTIVNQPLRIFCIFALSFVVTLTMVRVTLGRCRDIGLTSWQMFNPRYCLRILFGESVK